MSEMLKSQAKNPLTVLVWSLLSVFVGLSLGIITALILNVIGRARGVYANLEIANWAFSLAAIYLGLGGAALGGIVGFYIGVIRWAKARKREEP